MSHYPPIADHGLIGDLQTAALVSTDGTIDWFCCPRFDSPSVFGSLLDHQRGGHCRVRPAQRPYRTQQMYFPDTAILITRFMTDIGTGEVIDFMPPAGRDSTDTHRLVRMLRCVRGRITFELDIAPRFDYGRRTHTTRLTADGAVFDSGSSGLTLHAVREPGDDQLAQVQVTEDGSLHGLLPLAAGQVRGFVLESGAPGIPMAIPVAEIETMFDQAVQFWHTWLAHCTYRGRWREIVHRAAITLKLLTYAPTGAIVAAPTAGLPEMIGGERNWDYRYTWIRDASFSVSALLSLGFTEEATEFAAWLRGRYQDKGTQLEIMYRVDGSADLREEVLGHWEGYRGSSPVRIGNDASGQLQLDIYGELLDSIDTADRSGLRIGHEGWQKVTELLDWLAINWDQPEEGIWETRGGRADFTYGRLMTWVAFDRGIRLAERHSLLAPIDEWRRQRDLVDAQLWSCGWNERRRAFVQRYDAEVLDAALLRMAQVGFIAPRDPMWLSTLSGIRRELVTDSLVHRYNPSASPDGLSGSEGTFSLCTFDYVNALARAGNLTQARLVFEKMLTYSNHLGLYAEEIGLTGEQLGNFPQAFTHLSLIDAALTLDHAMDASALPVG
ncbi:glycoside hydrolase family 15 protein [Nocardia sp. NBC_01503]|uniref:glycoside hydrolase family 15 protein n=1 Tax=Nocardia sp. NBC_01503 TaxID=2975997 RepID=UPI002E7BC5D8|nr:glycoside hydrolase family 15 protein [Nocardia sp. NBC_01503]WTL36042.1 glycoside hydrolase family 15 protein [Nocardia sp. NBC_01503]